MSWHNTHSVTIARYFQGLVFNDHILDGVTLDRCEFVGIEWKSDNSITYDDPIIINTSPYIPTQLTRDFYEVKCFITPATGTEQMSDYEEYVAIITEDQTVSKRKQEAKRPSDKTQYNVLVISAEGLADEKFHPVFADVILKGYNSLGSDLPSSFIPLLTGINNIDIHCYVIFHCCSFTCSLNYNPTCCVTM